MSDINAAEVTPPKLESWDVAARIADFLDGKYHFALDAETRAIVGGASITLEATRGDGAVVGVFNIYVSRLA